MPIELSRHEEFAVITINRVESMNALNYAMLRQIGNALDEVESSDARGVFFIGAGNARSESGGAAAAGARCTACGVRAGGGRNRGCGPRGGIETGYSILPVERL